MTVYTLPKSGEWVKPIQKGYLLSCCDCGLVHKMDFRVVKKKVQYRAFLAKLSTAQMRRYMKPAQATSIEATLMERAQKERDMIRAEHKKLYRWCRETEKREAALLKVLNTIATYDLMETNFRMYEGMRRLVNTAITENKEAKDREKV